MGYLDANPGLTMVIMAGVGHAWKKGIPSQVRKRSSLPYTVLLPEIPGRIEREKIGAGDADYLIVDLRA